MVQIILWKAFKEAGVEWLHQGSRVEAQQGLADAPYIESRIQLRIANRLMNLVSKLSRCVLYGRWR